MYVYIYIYIYIKLLILINMDTKLMLLDSMHDHNFHYLTVAGAKMLSFFELIIVLLYIC